MSSHNILTGIKLTYFPVYSVTQVPVLTVGVIESSNLRLIYLTQQTYLPFSSSGIYHGMSLRVIFSV